MFLRNGSDFVQEISKEQYVLSISDYENAYLIQTCNGKIYLYGDIEYGGEVGLRIEMMNFEMDTDLPFSEASSECRGYYAGGINFIEYDNEEEAKQYVIQDFLNLTKGAKYISCKSNDMKLLTHNYKKHLIYIVVQD